MSDLSDMKGMIIGDRLAGVSMSRTANIMGVLRTTLSWVMTVYANLGKVSSTKHNSGRKLLKDCDRWMLKRIFAQKRKTTLSHVTSDMSSRRMLKRIFGPKRKTTLPQITTFRTSYP
ncbi:transposable element Tc1 transposase [Trichonephila clavipes]|nr:transposable element Tc1 transposase [Trichonephila clavipes]